MNQTFTPWMPPSSITAPGHQTVLIKDIGKDKTKTVTGLTRVTKPLIRHRVTMALARKHATSHILPERYEDQYVIAPTKELAISHVMETFGLNPEDYMMSALTLED